MQPQTSTADTITRPRRHRAAVAAIAVAAVAVSLGVTAAPAAASEEYRPPAPGSQPADNLPSYDNPAEQEDRIRDRIRSGRLEVEDGHVCGDEARARIEAQVRELVDDGQASANSARVVLDKHNTYCASLAEAASVHQPRHVDPVIEQRVEAMLGQVRRDVDRFYVVSQNSPDHRYAGDAAADAGVSRARVEALLQNVVGGLARRVNITTRWLDLLYDTPGLEDSAGVDLPDPRPQPAYGPR